MFICIKHGDNEQFLANTNCPLVLLLQYVRNRLGLPQTALIDLCDDRGSLKLLFLCRQPQESASRLLAPRATLAVCAVHQALQTQRDSLEKARLRQLRSQEDRRPESPAQGAPPAPAGRGKAGVRAGHLAGDTAEDDAPRRAGGKRGVRA
ncbi:uncharacterized protein CXorf65 homolog isoform X2 [Lepisosteus oculatus]|uniref:uncharacterized protein CXorf65 homolog isoform X2 n=1 Tax=Lepisosteus oculatus TaxID=7918 RepID=UPI003721C808